MVFHSHLNRLKAELVPNSSCESDEERSNSERSSNSGTDSHEAIEEGAGTEIELHPSSSPSKKIYNWLVDLLLPYKKYFEQRCLFASLSYILLYMTVLAPGALIINYLTFLGMQPLEIAAFQVCQLVYH